MGSYTQSSITVGQSPNEIKFNLGDAVWVRAPNRRVAAMIQGFSIVGGRHVHFHIISLETNDELTACEEDVMQCGRMLTTWRDWFTNPEAIDDQDSGALDRIIGKMQMKWHPGIKEMDKDIREQFFASMLNLGQNAQVITSEQAEAIFGSCQPYL